MAPAGRKLIVLAVAAGALVVPQAAQAEIDSVFNGDVACVVQGNGDRYCGTNEPRSTTKSPVDDVPIDVNVAFPPEPESGPDGGFPLVMMFHGYGGSKLGFKSMQHRLDRGYATFSMTDRGFGESCSSQGSKDADPTGCANGYIRLIDNRYEVRDAQDFAGELADEGAGLIDPQAIASVGGSYGGGMSMALGARKDRVVNLDDSLSPWQSPEGKPMQIAASAPNIPWTDLAYSLAPNGSTLDYVADAPYQGRPGVQKQALVHGLYGSSLSNFLAPPGTDPTADQTTWIATLDAGEPYGNDVQDILDELTLHHSSYYIDHSEPPAPMLMSSGFTDDLFPADETIRYYNRTKTEYPDADLALFFGDFGHPRAQNKADVTSALNDRIDDWFDYYVKGEGSAPQQGAEAYTLTCPTGAPSGGPYHAGSWAKLAPGEVRFDDPAAKTIDAGSNSAGAFGVFNNACASTSSDDIDGAATYELDAAPSGGYTLMGAVTVTADYEMASGDESSQVAARLVDVAPDDTETLVDRGLWRPDAGDSQAQVFQLHPNGWTFAPGHVPKLELMAADGTPGGGDFVSYGRPSNGQQDVGVSNLEMRMPVLEKPGSRDGLVKAPAPKVVPDGYDLAAEFAALPSRSAKLAGKKLKVKGGKAKAKVSCPAAFAACTAGKLKLKATGKKKFNAGSAGFDQIKGGKSATLKVKLSKRAKRSLKKHPKLAVKATLTINEVDRASKKNAKLVAKKHKKHKR
jgi:dienelactone hydrolase